MKKRHFILNKISIFIFSIICVGVCVCIAEVFASVLTVGSLNISSSSATTISDFKVYAISLGSYSTKNIAQSNAELIQKKNAAGFVYKSNGTYHVLASAYEKENDAKLVQENLLKENIKSEIVVVTFNQIQLEKVSSISQEKEFIESLNIFKTVFLKLYDISVSLDTSVFDQTSAKIKVIETKANVEETLQNLNKGTTSVDGIYYQIIKNKYNGIVEELNELKNYEETDGVVLSAKIKLAYLTILKDAEDLIDLLNNEI